MEERGGCVVSSEKGMHKQMQACTHTDTHTHNSRGVSVEEDGEEFIHWKDLSQWL